MNLKKEMIYIKSKILDNIYKLIDSFTDIYKIFVIGGSQIYKHFLPHVDRIYMTKIYHKYQLRYSF